MSSFDPSGAGGFLDVAPVNAAEYADIEDQCGRLFGTRESPLVFQGEATVALEAVARGLGRPAGRALNLVTGPYGTTFGRWLAEAGTDVDNVVTPFDRAVSPDQVEQALDRFGPVDMVSVVHAEAATGVVNDLAAIAKVARSRGALLVVDAVASVGAEPLAIDDWHLDVVVLSTQKALAGPAGASIVALSPGAWAALSENPAPWRTSVLSLLDWRDRWVLAGRAVLPVLPSHLETRALGAAAARAMSEGLDAIVARHQAAAAATRAALAPLDLKPWVEQPGEAASVATLVRAPAVGAGEFVRACMANWHDGVAPITVAPLSLSEQALRVNHTGRRANLATVWSAVGALAGGLRALGHAPDLGTALTTASDAWHRTLDRDR
jgi:aspartate aminotransferase-like enzyme